ncbi:MAG: efflux RND transporter permease subunit, partial [Planctomycetota bacterium]
AIEPMAPADAIVESVRTRMRPIFMTATTSVGGMLPLVLMPGAGSEMYRGLGSVVVGGLIASTVFTLLLVPLVFSLVLQMSEGLRRALGLASGLPHARAQSNREMRGGAATPTPAMALSPREDS